MQHSPGHALSFAPKKDLRRMPRRIAFLDDLFAPPLIFCFDATTLDQSRRCLLFHVCKSLGDGERQIDAPAPLLTSGAQFPRGTSGPKRLRNEVKSLSPLCRA